MSYGPRGCGCVLIPSTFRKGCGPILKLFIELVRGLDTSEIRSIRVRLDNLGECIRPQSLAPDGVLIR